MINLSYKLYKSDKNKKLRKLTSIACRIWNYSLALSKRYYKLYKKSINFNHLQKHIAKLRKKNSDWKLLNSQSVQEIIQRLELAYQRFFKKLSKGLPKFKKTSKFKSVVYKQSGYKLQDNKLTINGVGVFKFSLSRPYSNVKRISIKKDAVGDYFLIITCDLNSKNYKREGNSSIGMDFGLKTYLTISNGEEVDSPQFFKQGLSKVKNLSKKFSKKNKKSFSKGKTKAKVNCAKAYRDISNRRSDFHWKLAHKLCRENSFIAIEDLNIAAMKKLWGKKISDLAFSKFIDILHQVALKYDTKIQKIDRFYPSSKKCTCGVINKKLTLKDRIWTCESCNTTHNRDELASNNILSEGIRVNFSKSKTVAR
jgi:putative transposase